MVELCRARYVSERVILSCVKILVGKFGANPNVPSAERSTDSSRIVVLDGGNGRSSSGSLLTRTVGSELYPIVIAAARGMFSVVKCLLVCGGADVDVRGSSIFRLFSNRKKRVHGVNLTALEFARRMREEEILNGGNEEDLKGHCKIISLLEKASKA